jgi:hypothetical protein
MFFFNYSVFQIWILHYLRCLFITVLGEATLLRLAPPFETEFRLEFYCSKNYAKQPDVNNT